MFFFFFLTGTGTGLNLLGMSVRVRVPAGPRSAILQVANTVLAHLLHLHTMAAVMSDSPGAQTTQMTKGTR